MKNLKQFFRQALLAFLMVWAAQAQAAAVSYPLNLASGWSLLGNSLSTPMDVRTTLGVHSEVVSVWKWDAAAKTWAFYAPSLDTAGTLQAYANSRNYSVLSTIWPGEAYWIDTTAAVALGTQSGTGYSLVPAQLVTGWNLSATGDDLAPSLFSSSIGNVTSVWAWDNPNSKWYFYAQSMQANGSLAGYITSMGYKDFAALKLGNGLGFWVNYAGTGAVTGGGGNGSGPACMITAGTAKICYDSLPVPFTCDAKGMNDSTWVLDYAGYTAQNTKSYAALSSCAGSGYNMAGTVFATIASDAVVLTPFGTTLSLNGDYLDATGNAARFYFDNGFGTASGITWDGTNLWVADTSNKAIRKLDPVTGAVTSLSAQFTNPDTGQTYNPLIVPKGITSDSTNLYVTDQGNIYQIAKATGVVTIVSGYRYGQVPGGWGTVHIGTLPATSKPSGITNDGTYLYFSDLDYTSGSGSVIKMNLATKVFTTVATIGASNAFTAAGPRGITTDGTNLYVVSGADRTIVKIVIATGAKTTLAGNPNASTMRDGVGTDAVFLTPTDITTDGSFLYVTDTNNDYPGSAGSPLVRKIEISTGIVTSLTRGFSMGFLDGGADVALFNGLGGITNIGSTLYVTDNLSAVRKIVYGAAAQGIGNVVTPLVPVAPGGVSASTASATSINVSWSAVNTATGYLVYRATSPNQLLSLMTKITPSPVAGTTVLDSGLGAGTYYYRVVALNAVGVGPTSTEVSVTTVPFAPTNLGVTVQGSTSINVFWTAATGATGYNVYRATSAGQPLASMTKLNATPVVSGSAYLDTGLTPFTVYYYKVTAVNANGASAASAEAFDRTGPLATGLGATQSGSDTINLTWSAASGATGYNVYRGASAGLSLASMTKLTATPQAGTTYSDTGLGSLSTYYYKVVGMNGNTPGDASTEANATTGPAAPVGVTATNSSSSSISVTWTAVSGASGYNVYRSTTASQALAAMTKITATPVTPTTYLDTGLAASTTYYYKVVALNGAVASSPSGEGSASTGGGGAVTTQMGGSRQGTPLSVATNGGVVTTFAGQCNVTPVTSACGQGAANGIGQLASFNRPGGVTTDGTNLYVLDAGNYKIRKVKISTGAVSTLAGSGVAGTADNANGALATFAQLIGITTDGTNVYVTDGARIRVISIATGAVSTMTPVYSTLTLITTDGTNLYVIDAVNNWLYKVNIATQASVGLVSGKASRGYSPPIPVATANSITTDGTNLYVASASVVYYYNPLTAATGTLAGSGTRSFADGIGTAASFDIPAAMTTDGANLYVSETGNFRVRKIVIATGVVTTLAGTATQGLVNGTGAAARFMGGTGITTDGVSLYLTDLNMVRNIQ